MNFIAETDRFARDLENWKKGHGYTNTDGLKDLMAIWHTFVNLPERKAVTYPNVTASIPLVDHNCGKCGPLTDALTLIYNWRNSKELQNEVTVVHENVNKAEVKMSFDVPQTFPKVDSEPIWITDPATVEVKAFKMGSEFEKELNIPIDLGGTIDEKGHIVLFDKNNVDYSKLKMHQLRSIAKKKRIEYSNKTTKEELIRLING